MRENWAPLLTFGSLLAIAWSILQFYVGYDGTFPTMIVRPWHVTLAAAVAFASIPLFRKGRSQDRHVAFSALGRPDQVLSAVLIAVSILIGVYFAVHGVRLESRTPFVDELEVMDLVVGSLVVLLVLEATRRVTGLALPIVCLIFLAYNVLGPWMPGDLKHSGINFHDFVELQTMSTQGIFGVPVGVSSTYVFYFILFAAFMEASGGGALFIDFALAATGRRRGGGAKAAVVGSSLFGMISGSAIANVTGSGIFTIPLMKRVGYTGTFAAAVEALASTGGQIMPPLMGAGAFIMAQMLGRQYGDIALAAALPAILYFVSAYFIVDFQARKAGLHGLSKSELPDLRQSVLKLHLLLPIGYLVYGILSGMSLMMSALQSIALIVAISYIRRATWFTPHKLVSALANGGRGAVAVALPCATAGMVVGVTVGPRTEVLGPDRFAGQRRAHACVGPRHDRLHHHGHGAADHGGLHSRRHPHGAGVDRARRERARRAHVRLLLRLHLDDHAARGTGILCRERHRRIAHGRDRLDGVQDRLRGLPGTLRLRLRSRAGARGVLARFGDTVRDRRARGLRAIGRGDRLSAA